MKTQSQVHYEPPNSSLGVPGEKIGHQSTEEAIDSITRYCLGLKVLRRSPVANSSPLPPAMENIEYFSFSLIQIISSYCYDYEELMDQNKIKVK